MEFRRVLFRSLLGTRVLFRSQIVPLEVSQSQTSLPSRSIASLENPPPGKTSIAAPLPGCLAGNTVRVGTVTLKTPVTGRPAKRFGFVAVSLYSGGSLTSSMFGAALGHNGVC